MGTRCGVAADLTAPITVAVVQLMDDVDGFGSSEGATQLRMDGFGEAGSRIGQMFRPGRGKTEAMGQSEPCVKHVKHAEQEAMTRTMAQ